MGLELDGKAQTVLGPISGDDLGITLPHEHLIIDASSLFMEPSGIRERQLAYQPVSLENIGHIRLEPRSNLDNTRMLDEEKVISEAFLYKSAGGNTIVDCTPIDLGRNPLSLVRISEATGLNVIMGSGYYKGAIQAPEMDKKGEEDITDEIVREITVGVGANQIRTGIIGEIGIASCPLTNNETKVLRAAAQAQQHTGAPLSIHPGYCETSALEIISLLSDAGADISRTIICHVDISVRKESTRQELAKTGCYLGYDHLGREEYYSLHAWTTDLPDDLRRIDEIMQLIGWGYLNQLLVSHDIGTKDTRSSYGGWGYAHLLRHFVPLMRRQGISEDVIHTILVENPKRIMSFV